MKKKKAITMRKKVCQLIKRYNKFHEEVVEETAWLCLLFVVGRLVFWVIAITLGIHFFFVK